MAWLGAWIGARLLVFRDDTAALEPIEITDAWANSQSTPDPPGKVNVAGIDERFSSTYCIADYKLLICR